MSSRENGCRTHAVPETIHTQRWGAFLKRLYTRINEHDLLARSAQLSYYFLLALFPLLVFLVTLLAYFVQAGSQLRSSLLNYLGTVMPYSAITLVHATLDEITMNRRRTITTTLRCRWNDQSPFAA